MLCWCCWWCIVPIWRLIRPPVLPLLAFPPLQTLPLFPFGVWWFSICGACVCPIMSDISVAAGIYGTLPNDVTSAILSKLSDRMHWRTKRKGRKTNKQRIQVDESRHFIFNLKCFVQRKDRATNYMHRKQTNRIRLRYLISLITKSILRFRLNRL